MDGVILITDGDTRDITLVTTTHVTTAMATTTTHTTMEEEDPQLTTDQEDILQEAHTIVLAEIMLAEETTPQTEIATQLIDVVITQTSEEALM